MTDFTDVDLNIDLEVFDDGALNIEEQIKYMNRRGCMIYGVFDEGITGTGKYLYNSYRYIPVQDACNLNNKDRSQRSVSRNKSCSIS